MEATDWHPICVPSKTAVFGTTTRVTRETEAHWEKQWQKTARQFACLALPSSWQRCGTKDPTNHAFTLRTSAIQPSTHCYASGSCTTHIVPTGHDAQPRGPYAVFKKVFFASFL
jgi:hypothetical protein